ncbi:hypothetical protein [Bradyrhizobium sp. AUGA SZCCT0283]|uniref:hypothetical protein n=1 Tax=Bradyrhizobium sp. AUGA SZCCT0283 TaxID=2807671 RepID=UPI001BA46CBC|nr:hypothetical protein [Bradyrhizobium sp. AUGA SZCCT0283]MBR1274451.1 hypothetical protein [Bradyrhizobium sp. AUGA SZCCT0283]
MTQSVEFLDLIRTAFPAEPVPAQFFWRQGKDSLDLDIPQELRSRLLGRPWTEVTLMDWRMTGTSPVLARRYLEPGTFMYYVPSIIVGVSQDIGFVELALEGIIPDNKYHVPRGQWWSEFSGIASLDQRAALSAFLSHIRRMSWDEIGPANQYLLEHAESVWSN